MTNQKSDIALDAVKAVATALAEGKPESDVWKTFEREMTAVFGQRYFTVLAFDSDSSRMCRLYSNRPDIGPVGGVKRVTRSPWVQHVLLDGKIYVGSTKADVKSAFSEHEKLWSIGCESTLNIPIRKNGLRWASSVCSTAPTRMIPRILPWRTYLANSLWCRSKRASTVSPTLKRRVTRSTYRHVC